MVILKSVEEFEVVCLGEELVQLRLVCEFELHEPAILLSRDRNVLRLVLELGVDERDGAVARHVHVGGSLDTLNCALFKRLVTC